MFKYNSIRRRIAIKNIEILELKEIERKLKQEFEESEIQNTLEKIKKQIERKEKTIRKWEQELYD